MEPKSTMSDTITRLGLVFALLAGASTAVAGLYVYPREGQSAEQTEKDKYDCFGWASQNTGFDPNTSPLPVPPSQVQSQTGRAAARGAAGGAIAGALIGGISGGKAGKGAAAGAIGGGLIGGIRQSNSQSNDQAQRNAQYDQQVAAYNGALADHDRAYAACLEGRGYTVR